MSVDRNDRLAMSLRECWLVAAGCVFVAVVLHAPLLFMVPGRDGGVFMYIGQGILLGEIPYVDAWDHKPPLIHFTYALGLLIAGGRFWGVWMLAIGSVAGAGWLSYRVLRSAHGAVIATAATAIWILNLANLIGESLNTELFTLPLQLGALVVLVRWRDAPGSGRWPFVLGLLAGFAFLYRQNHVAVFAAVFLTGTVIGGGWRGTGHLLRCAARTTAGGIVAMAPLAAFFLVNGAWGAMWDAAFRYNILYSGPGIVAQLDAAGFGIERIPWCYGAFLVWLVALLWVAVRQPLPGGRRGILLCAAIVAVPLEFYLATASGKHHAHYFATCLPALAILLAELFSFLGRPTAASPRLIKTARVVLVVLVAAALWALQFDGLTQRYATARDPDAEQATRWCAEYLRTRTTPDQRSLVWGADSVILALAGRRSATRYVYQYPLITAGYRSDDVAAEFLADLERHPPAVIVDSGHRWFPTLDAARRVPVQLPDRIEARVYGRVSPRLEPFFDRVARDYARVTENERITIYVPRP